MDNMLFLLYYQFVIRIVLRLSTRIYVFSRLTCQQTTLFLFWGNI